jgi:peroxiredoxin
MDVTLLATRVLLAGVFALAGVTKLADRQGSRQAAVDFGVPAPLATPVGVLLPLAELAVAAALIPATTATWGAAGALALLLVFVAGIASNLARGREPECRCFGQLHSAPAGYPTLLRNGLLAALAGFVLWQGRSADAGPSVVGWLATLSAAQALFLGAGLVVLGLVAAQWWFLIHLLRQNGRLLVRIEALEAGLVAAGVASAPDGGQARSSAGLPVGEEAPPFALKGLNGETLTLETLHSSGKPVMLLFTDPDCGPCATMLPEIGRWQEEHAERLTVSLISRGDLEENRAAASEHGLRHVLLQKDWEVSEAYRVGGTPSAVLVLPEGKVGSPLASGAEAIRALLWHAIGEPCPDCGKAQPAADRVARAVPARTKLGEPTPEVRLPDLSGETVALNDFRGQQTLVLLWNPGCGFCQQMLPDLKEWEDNLPEGGPRLLVVSAGTEEANRAMGLNSPVVLDQQFTVGRAFGASGTPSAVLVDEEGKVASELAVGTAAVLKLARVVRARL